MHAPIVKVFFDTEFTHFQEPLFPEPPELISIGCISEDGATFYAENRDFNVQHCSEFVKETVIPLLDGGDSSMPYSILANKLNIWIQEFKAPVSFITDSPSFDWPFVEHLFCQYGWPPNLIVKPTHIAFNSVIQTIRFQHLVEQTFYSHQPKLRRHHALDDAIANRIAYLNTIQRYI